MQNCGAGFLMKLASRPVKPPNFPAARAVRGAAPPPPGGGSAPSPTIMHAWFGPPVDVPGPHTRHTRTSTHHGHDPISKAIEAVFGYSKLRAA